jgi:hypothetical protein
LRAEYALQAELVLGLNYGRSVARIQTTSDQQNIPKRFLELVLSDLNSGGLVRSKHVAASCYRLSHKPEQITVTSIERRDVNWHGFVATVLLLIIDIEITTFLLKWEVCAMVVVFGVCM